jgi:hypothetical protein
MCPITRINEESPEIKKSTQQEPRSVISRAASYISNSQRGLGPEGGGWNIAQAAHWSGFSAAHLRNLIKRREGGEQVDIFPYYRCGRRVLIPREGFRAWFNSRHGQER